MAREAGVLFIVNDRPDVALACGADGVHLGQSDMPVGTARQLAPPGFVIGASVGTVREAQEAEQSGADYVALSPVFATGSKDDAGPGHGLDELRAIRAAVRLPVLAIGGITRENAAEVIAAGADGIAVISAVVAAADIAGAARELREQIRKVPDRGTPGGASVHRREIAGTCRSAGQRVLGPRRSRRGR